MEALHRKIVPVELLAQRLRERRATGGRVVQCHGCFDIVHPGHVRYLQFARSLGDVLVVSLTGDSQISKGPDRPYIPQELRAENLAALEFVDFVVIDPNPTAAELLEALQPDVYVKGREYAGSSDPRFRREAEIVERHGGRVVFHSGDVVFSSTRLIRELEQDADLDEVRLRTLCARGGIDQKTIAEALDRAGGCDVVVIGDVIRERYVLCDPGPAASDAPMMCVHALETTEFWGGAAAVAQQAAALGARVRLVTCAANGPVTARLCEELAAADVAVELVPTTTEFVENTTFVGDDAKLFRVARGAATPLDSRRESQTIELVSKHTPRNATLVWCDYGFGAISAGIVSGTLARVRGVRSIGCSPNALGDIGALRGVETLVLSERRLREAMRDMNTGLPAVAWRLLYSSEASQALIGLHKRGFVGFSGRDQAGTLPERLHSEFVPSLASRWVDRLGVDEAVTAAVSTVLATGGSLALAGYLAAAIEALAAARPGRRIVSRGELQRWCDGRAELRGESQFMPDAARWSDIAMIAPPLAASGA
jgi:rfaE bifunctional protein nucleotidyltransferase chain/domain